MHNKVPFLPKFVDKEYILDSGYQCDTYVFVFCFSYMITLTNAYLHNSVIVLSVYYSTGVIRGDLCSRNVANPFTDDWLSSF